MTVDSPIVPKRRMKAKKLSEDGPLAERVQEGAIIELQNSGDWIPADELRKTALDALALSSDLTLNFNGIDNLDASALQILLAMEFEQKRRGTYSKQGRSRTSRSYAWTTTLTSRPHPEHTNCRCPRLRRTHSFSVLACSSISWR